MKTITPQAILIGTLLLAGCEVVGYQIIARSQHPLSHQLTQAAGTGDIPQVDRLLTAGAPLREPYPLQAAVLHRQYDMVTHLVDRGAPVNGDGRLQSPLWFAAAHGDSLMTALLISLGANVDWQTDQMGTPLHAALSSYQAQDARLPIARLLMDHAADVNAIQRDETLRGDCLATALQAAVFSVDRASVELLLARGADRNATDGKGRTPLDCARERLQIVRVDDLRASVEDMVSLLETEHAPSR